MSRYETFQSIDTSLDIFGFEVPVTFDGRRIWPPRLKVYLLDQLEAGELSATEICKTCDISPLQLSRWQLGTEPLMPKPKAFFAEVKLTDTMTVEDRAGLTKNPDEIVLRTNRCELRFPINYPIERFAVLLELMEREE